jgi:hypothetical protein
MLKRLCALSIDTVQEANKNNEDNDIDFENI